MTIEPHTPPPDRRDDDGLPTGDWPIGTLIVIFAIVVVVLLAFVQLS